MLRVAVGQFSRSHYLAGLQIVLAWAVAWEAGDTGIVRSRASGYRDRGLARVGGPRTGGLFITRERTESEAVLAEAEAPGKRGLRWTAAPPEGPVDGPQMDPMNNDLAGGADDYVRNVPASPQARA